VQVTKELIESEIKGVEGQIEQLKSSLFQAQGALIMLQGIHQFIEKPEPQVNSLDISQVNKAVQDMLETKQQKEKALSMQEVAELVAGPGAVVEAVEEIQHG
jgi:hypothetical protein